MSMGRSIWGGGARRTNSAFAKWHIESPVTNGKMRARRLKTARRIIQSQRTTARPRRPTKTLRENPSEPRLGTLPYMCVLFVSTYVITQAHTLR